MMLIIAIILFCCIACIRANESVLLTGNEKVKDFVLYNNSRFNVFIEAYPGFTWILDNLEEVKKADIEPLNLMPSQYSNEPNAGEYIVGNPQDEAYGGYFQFIFKKNDSVMKELPPLKFIFKNDSDPEGKEILAQVNLKVGEGKPLSLGLINDPTSNIIKIEEEGGEFDLYVNSNSANFVFLYGSISNDNTLSSGYSWYMENADIIESNPFVELLELDSFANRPGSYYNPMTTLYKYIFQVNDFTAKDVLPTLIFSYKESSESTSYKARAVVNLRSYNETIVTFNDEESNKSLNVDINEVLLVELNGNPSTGYNWMLENAEDVEKTEGIEALNVDKDRQAPFVVTTENKPGAPGVFRFKFQITKNAQAGPLPTTLKFIQARSENDVAGTAELSLMVKKERKEEDLKDMSLPVLVYDKNPEEDNIIYVESNTILQFTRESNPSTGCSWMIKNQEEIERSDFIDYIGNTYKSLCENKPGNLFQVGGCGGDETFSFRIWDVSEEDKIPEIHMVYGHSWAIETEFYETLDLVIKVKKSEKENDKEEEKEKEEDKEKKEKEEEDMSLPIIIYDKDPKEDNVIYVESNTILQFTKESNPSTGCSWIIKNEDEIKNSDFIDYIGSTYNSLCKTSPGSIQPTGCGGDETFSFRIGEVSEKDKIPEIHMVYGHSWAIETEFYDTLDLVIKVKKSEKENDKKEDKEKKEKEEDLKDMSLPIIIYDKDPKEDNVIYVESNTILQFTKESNPSTGCSWIIKNEDEIKNSDFIDYIGSTYKSLCEDISENQFPVGGCGGDETFSFRIGEVSEEDKIPEIHMVYGHSWAIETEFYDTLDLVIKVKKNGKENDKKEDKEKKEKEEDLKDMSLPIIIYDKDPKEDNVIYVESNTILQFTKESNPSTGCSWIIKNEDEIKNSDFIDYIGSTYKSLCEDISENQFPAGGCGGDETFSFRIGEVSEEDKIPEIHMVYGHSWAIETEFYDTLDLVIKVKKSEKEKEEEKEIECSMKGYKCCTKSNPKVRYHDNDGNWGVENGDWCYIKEDQDQGKKNESKLIRTCTVEKLGYSCCKKEHKNIYTDSDGQWAVEDGEWCGIPTCTYTGDYPVCKKTTKVVYEDNEKWGVEEGQWCVLCL